MPSINRMAPRDKTETFSLFMNGEKTTITYYPNRLTMEGEPEIPVDENDAEDAEAMTDEDRTSLRTARNTCYIVAEWDITGELRKRNGDLVPNTSEDLIIPLEADIVRYIPLTAIRAINQKIVDHSLGFQKPKPR